MVADRIDDLWGGRTPYAPGERWPARVDQHLGHGIGHDEVQRWVRSASVLHSNGDALDIAVVDDRIVGVRGRADDRVNRGRVDVKDLYGWQASSSQDRLTRPLVRQHGRLVEATWDDAMGRIVERSRSLLDEHGPAAIGFYTSGQLFLEEYYTLGVIAHGAIGTDHVDGNTRLCTATAAEALKASFASDGQPGTYTDFDHADTIALFGHNIAETQSVTWMRILDRLAGPHPPAIVCVDPRTTPVARHATVHLAPLPGTNVALMNGLLHEIIANDWVDHDYIDAHTVGFDDLRRMVDDYPPERVAEICDVPADDLRHAARLLGSAERLVSTVLQGFYQSHQATAAAVQVNNIHLIRGMLGRPGCGLLQMNGQPTAENTRECGADGDLAGFRNWENDAHVRELADLWNIEKDRLPHENPPTHAMEIFRLAEEGTIRMLWISATNPAVSLPELGRIRAILERDDVFVVAQDMFSNETTALADVVLPAAGWGEKTGTFTNADRTVHLSEKAVDPPGEARADLDIFLDYARRMDFRDRDGKPLPPWTDAESAFDAWRACSAGRPCDYSGMTYELLRTRGGVQWPCTADAPGGTERLYADGRFYSAADYCESYGKDLLTGEPLQPDEYRDLNPGARALIKAAPHLPPPESPSADHPFALITGRTVYHFHTRTKTGRAPELDGAAPDVWVEVNALDAARSGVHDGDLVEIASPRGAITATVRIAAIRRGVLFVPFHYGYWDADDDTGNHRAANELTITDWDSASKQPIFKMGAASMTLVTAK
ncbi:MULTISPECIES: molybdopterin oxidoreductase family protein [unclassified Gordonia (in: high G+C Gram-positive bacteria)]|uniref:molybdopterin oxidoreductase family protein n=1 Tax=unclassified Gordonia (in: high G+C Gram-positive bacteria) TaxID=2657482 RepID=UPI00196538BD|nr:MULTISPECIES: nitrate reductase [unclassified Gordonia (in: high G+C Gram-positive bacteria)]MBN0971040.1 nitrate reductase [Gordonia sp. BP-119]MBN0982380.1 nitrate reductase [Gordonia sp. BP-94]